MIIRRHLYSGQGVISAIVRDGNYLWVAYKNTSACRLKKVSIFDPSLIYYDIAVNVDEITRLKIDGSYLYLSIDDDTYIAARYSRTNPLGSYNFISIPSGINEKSVDLAIHSNGSDWFLLTPGELSGENAKVINISSVTFQETIDLTTIFNAKSMTIDENDNLWAVTDESPAKLVKIYDDGGYTYNSWNITV